MRKERRGEEGEEDEEFDEDEFEPVEGGQQASTLPPEFMPSARWI